MKNNTDNRINVAKVIFQYMKNHPYNFGLMFLNSPIGISNGRIIYKVSNKNTVRNNKSVIAISAMSEDRKSYIVITDDYYDEAPVYVQEFIELHEIGHIKNGDLDSNKSICANKLAYNLSRCVGLGRGAEIEYAADKYSASIVGYNNAINALRYLVDNFNFGLGGNSEIRRRIKRLQREMG